MGVGNEPSLSEIESTLSSFPDLWFDGTREIKTIRDLSNELSAVRSSTEETISRLENLDANRFKPMMGKNMLDPKAFVPGYLQYTLLVASKRLLKIWRLDAGR